MADHRPPPIRLTAMHPGGTGGIACPARGCRWHTHYDGADHTGASAIARLDAHWDATHVETPRITT